MLPTLELAHAQFIARARHEARAETSLESLATDEDLAEVEPKV